MHVNRAGARTQARVARGSWSTPRALGHEPDSPGTAGRLRRTWDKGPICPGELVDPVGSRNRVRVSRECWWIPRGLGHEPESPGTSGRPHGTSDTGPKCPGDLVDPVGTETRPQVTWDSWSTLRAPDTGLCPPGELVEHAGDWRWARVLRDRWSTLRAFGHESESPERSSQHRGPSDASPSGPGHVVDFTGPQTTAHVTQDT